MNVYEWMFQYKRNPVTAPTPVTGPDSFFLNPNPAKDNLEIRIQSAENGLTTLSVYSINGMLVRQWTLNKQALLLQQVIPVNELAVGSYILQIRMGGWQKSKTFIKN